jgi:hypothetical protein
MNDPPAPRRREDQDAGEGLSAVVPLTALGEGSLGRSIGERAARTAPGSFDTAPEPRRTHRPPWANHGNCVNRPERCLPTSLSLSFPLPLLFAEEANSERGGPLQFLLSSLPGVGRAKSAVVSGSIVSY